MKLAFSSIAVAVAAALSTGAASAQSSIVLNGLVDVNLQSSRISGDGFSATERGTRTAVDSNGMTTSWWGMRGSEDLGGGVRAIFELGGFLRPDTGEVGRFGTTDGLFKRAAYAGVESPYGRLTAGRHGTLYATSIYATNPFGDSFSFAPMLLNTYSTSLGAGLGIRDGRTSYIRNDSGWSNSVLLATPNMSGFTASALVSSASGSNDQEDPVLKKRGRAYAGQLAYRSGPLVALGVYQDIEINGAGQKQSAWLIGGAYDLKVVRLFAQYQSIDSTVTAGKDNDTSWQLGASMPFGKHTLLASYVSTKTEDKASLLADETRDTYSLGYRYDFSRRTDGYVVYMNDKLDAGIADKKRSVAAVGIRHRF
jgi:predicted porin